MLFTWPGRRLLTLPGPILAPLVKTRSQLRSPGSFRVCREIPSSTFIHIREYQMLSSLIPTLCVPQHLGVSCAEVIRLSYIIHTISQSSWRSSCCTTHTVQNALLFFSSCSCKLATLGNVIWLSFLLFFSVLLEYIWIRFCFIFFLFIYCV